MRYEDLVLMFKFIKPKNSTELDLVRPNCTDMHTALFVSPDTVVALRQPLFFIKFHLRSKFFKFLATRHFSNKPYNITNKTSR